MNEQYAKYILKTVRRHVGNLLTDDLLAPVSRELPEYLIKALAEAVTDLSLATAVTEGVGKEGGDIEEELKLANHVYRELNTHITTSLNRILNIQTTVGVFEATEEIVTAINTPTEKKH